MVLHGVSRTAEAAGHGSGRCPTRRPGVGPLNLQVSRNIPLFPGYPPMWGFDSTAGHANKGAQCQKASLERNIAMPWPPQVQYVQVQDQDLIR